MSAADVYSDNVAAIQEKIKQLQGDRIESFDNLANSITSKYNSNMQDYTEKWRTVAEAPVETLAGLAGGKGIYKGAKKVYDIYQKRKAARAERAQKQQEQQREDVGENEDFDEDPEELDLDLPEGRQMFMTEDDVDENQTFYNADDEPYFTGSQATHDEYYNEDGTLKDPTNVPEGHRSNDQQNDEDDQQDVEPEGLDDDELDEDPGEVEGDLPARQGGLDDDDLDADAGQVEGDLPARQGGLDEDELDTDPAQVEGDLSIPDQTPAPPTSEELDDFEPEDFDDFLDKALAEGPRASRPTDLDTIQEQPETLDDIDPTERLNVEDTQTADAPEVQGDLPAERPPADFSRPSRSLPQDDVADRNTNIFDPDDEFADDPSFGLPNTDVSTNAYTRSVGQSGDAQEVTREDFAQDRPPEIPTEAGADVEFSNESDILGQGDPFFQPTSGRPVYSEVGRGGRLVQDEPDAEGLARDPSTGLTQPEAQQLQRPPTPEPQQAEAEAEAEPQRPELDDLEGGQAEGPTELPGNNPYANVRTGNTEPSSNNMPSNDTSAGGEGGGGDGLVGGEQDLVEQGLQGGEEAGETFLSRAGTSIFNNLAQRGQSIRQGFNSVKNFFSRSGSGSEAGETAGEVAGEAGADAGVEAGLGTADAVLGAVPVVGEIALAVSGIVAIGEGIWHLFHHPKPPTAPTAAPLTAPSTMTAKYSLALPSADNSVDKAGSVGTF